MVAVKEASWTVDHGELSETAIDKQTARELNVAAREIERAGAVIYVSGREEVEEEAPEEI